MRITAVLCMCSIVAGCAAQQPQTWYKTGATEAEFDVAMARCRMGVAGLPAQRGTGAAADLRDAATSIQYMNDCLTSQGFHR